MLNYMINILAGLQALEFATTEKHIELCVEFVYWNYSKIQHTVIYSGSQYRKTSDYKRLARIEKYLHKRIVNACLNNAYAWQQFDKWIARYMSGKQLPVFCKNLHTGKIDISI